MKQLFACIIAALVCAAGCQTKGPAFDARSSQEFATVPLTNAVEPALLKAPEAMYRLGPADVVTVEALGDPGPGLDLTVGVDGKIYYSLLPGISVWGLTLAETRDLLEREMAKYVNPKPSLVLNLRSAASRRIWMLGGAANAVYALGGPTTLLEAVSTLNTTPTAMASARDDTVDFSRSFVLRNGRRIPVNFERLLREGDLSQNIYLEPDDFIYLPRANQAHVYVLGAVAGSVVLPYHRDMSLVSALAMAGSTVKYAYSTHISIIRGGLTNPRIAEVNYKAVEKGKAPDVRLEPGDIVYVRDIPGKFLFQLAEDVLDEFVRTIAVNEGIYVGSGQDQPIQPSTAFGTPGLR